MKAWYHTEQWIYLKENKVINLVSEDATVMNIEWLGEV